MNYINLTTGEKTVRFIGVRVDPENPIPSLYLFSSIVDADKWFSESANAAYLGVIHIAENQKDIIRVFESINYRNPDFHKFVKGPSND